LESGGGTEVHVDAARGVAGLLEEARVSGELEDVDRDVAPLRGEDGIHDWNVLRAEVGGDGEDEDAGDQVGLIGGVRYAASGLYVARESV